VLLGTTSPVHGPPACPSICNDLVVPFAIPYVIAAG
jgi:hypothetical protein